MDVRNYRDFVLELDDLRPEAGPPGSFAVRVFDSPAGQAERKSRVTVPDPRQFDDWVRTLAAGALKPEDQLRLGTLLGDLLLPDPPADAGPSANPRQMFRESLALLREGEALRVRLRAPGALAELPWEFACLPNIGFLLFNPRVSLVRHDAFAGLIPGDLYPPPQRRRVVYAIANPKDDRLRSLTALPGERSAVRAALNGRPDLDVVYLPAADPPTADFQGATLDDLYAALTAERTDVFHFSGHGEFSRGKGGGGRLVLADAQNRPLRLAADKLGEFLRVGVRLVVLGACHTADRDARYPWTGVAEALLRAGVPAVLAMQFPVSDHLAAAFCGAFYRAVTAGWLIDAAVAAGRLAMRAAAITAETPDATDWCCPVLHLRSATGHLFNPVPAAQPAELANEYEVNAEAVARTGTVIGALDKSGVTVRLGSPNVDGVMIGDVSVKREGGRVKVVMKLGTVTGLVVGGMDTGGADPGEAIAKLKKYLLAPEDDQ